MATKEYDYVITLRQENAKAADIFGVLLSALPFAYFLRLFSETGQTLFPISAGIIMLLLIVNFIKWRKKKPINFRFVFGVIAITFIIIKNEFDTIWLAVLYFVLIFAEAQFKRMPEKGFDANGITDNGWIRTFVPWNEIKNVLVKDGLLTVDYKNNKLIQKEIDGESTPATDAEFNSFCALQITKSI